MDGTWLDEEIGQCLEAVQKILLNSRKPYTRSTYLVWSRSKGIQPMSACVQDILDYLSHLKSLSLALSSLRVHLVAISTFHPLIQGKLISSNSMVVRFLKGIVHL